MKNQPQFTARIEKIEADQTRRAEEKRHEAFGRLSRLLDAGLLPNAPPAPCAGFSRCEPELLALDDRITGGTETAGDVALLALLPADDLTAIHSGLDARRFVAIMAKGYRMF